MEFNIGPEFSREFTFEEGRITYKLADKLNDFFKDKEYGERILKIYISVICVSKDFEAFCVVRPPKVLRNQPALEYELKLDFDTFKPASEEERKQLLVSKIFEVTKEVLMSKTIKGFEKEQFIEDLESYFKEQGYLEKSLS
ncbi:Imm44 family immunity protein [Polaribacter cellanae]|uniref:Uncharacterized protein n=1 Tax=Polaribacter cellanae TaxID=2818493 RepID=A0A975CM65_9FLAO|nr:Imm44 family immunity protein [Polaribacter cellanae]QTE21174.1 hypothetical protein J3359_09990 [Polaribacter cellanae]